MITREDITVTLQILSTMERETLDAEYGEIDILEFQTDCNDIADLLQRLLSGEPVDLTVNGGSPVPRRVRD